MLNINKRTKTKAKRKSTLMFKNCSYVCAYHCVQLLHTAQQRRVLITFPLTLQTIIIARMMFNVYWRGRGTPMQSLNQCRNCMLSLHPHVDDQGQHGVPDLDHIVLFAAQRRHRAWRRLQQQPTDGLVQWRGFTSHRSHGGCNYCVDRQRIYYYPSNSPVDRPPPNLLVTTTDARPLLQVVHWHPVV